jgi:outer membrane protein assembly factor BamB
MRTFARASSLFFLPLLLLISAVGLTGVLPAADWPMWRGPNSDGFSPETNLPSTWSPEGENLLWKVPIGSRSTPVVLRGQACAISLANPETPTKWQTRIFCLDSETGAIRWEHYFNVFQTDIPHHRVGWASLAGDAETGNIYFHGIEGFVVAFDKDGKILWQRSLDEQIGRFSGFGGRTVTPVVDGDLVIVSFLTAGWGPNFIPRHRFYALDKRSGEIVWQSTPGGRPLDTTYSAGVVRVINGERLLIDGNADGGIYAVRVATGERVWGFPLSKRGINSSVVVDGNYVYASHSEENADGSTAMGRIVCLDAGQITDGKPKEVWRAEGVTAGYASPAIYKGVLYHVDNSANLLAFDGKTGKELWKYNVGVAQRASPTIADGKIFVSDVDGTFHILKLTDGEPQRLDLEAFKKQDGSSVQINGSPAIANGRIFLPTENMIYAIGFKGAKPAPPAVSALPPIEKAPAGAQAASLQITPAEVVLKPGAQQKFRARTFDAKGRLIGEVQPQWSVQKLQASITPAGDLTVAKENIPQGGGVVAALGELKGTSLVSSRPVIPFEQDFESLTEGSVPAGWPGAQGRFQGTTLEGNKVLKKPAENPLSWRTTLYIGDSHASGYTIECDLMGTEARRRLPDMGLVSHRYTLDLMGNSQQLMLRTWTSELDRFSKVVPYEWGPDVWYHMKFAVDLAAAGGKAILRGKVWKKGEAEPAAWTIEAEDALPHVSGSPGIYGYSSADIYYDNVSVHAPK